MSHKGLPNHLAISTASLNYAKFGAVIQVAANSIEKDKNIVSPAKEPKPPAWGKAARKHLHKGSPKASDGAEADWQQQELESTQAWLFSFVDYTCNALWIRSSSGSDHERSWRFCRSACFDSGSQSQTLA